MKIKQNVSKEISIKTPSFWLSKTPVSIEVFAITETSFMKLYISSDVANVQTFPINFLTETLVGMEDITEEKFLDYYQKALKIQHKFIAEFQTEEIPY